MPRFCASGHRPSRQERKLAAAARMASAVISGWPDGPDSPLHSGAPDASEGGLAWPEPGPGRLKSERRSNPWPRTGPASTAAAKTAWAESGSRDVYRDMALISERFVASLGLVNLYGCRAAWPRAAGRYNIQTSAIPRRFDAIGCVGSFQPN